MSHADTNASLAARASQSLLGNYRPAPIVLAKGKGAELWDVDGKRYLDLYGGIAVSTVGHAHPHLVEAIASQAASILHTTNLVLNEPAIRLAERLIERTRPSSAAAPTLARAFFCNSGTEAIEACVKLARRAAFLRNEPDRTRFVAFSNSFHGRSMGALPLTGTPKYWEGFGCDVERVTHATFGDLGSVRAVLEHAPRSYCGIVVEPVQGEGGVLPAPPGFLAGLRALADEFGALLIVDEVQTGIGRTGSFYAHQCEGVVPDAVALAKGLGGGVPIGAMLVHEKHDKVLTPGTHGSTFGGNPIATAAANAVLDIIEREDLLAHVQRVGEHLGAGLAKLAGAFPRLFDGERGLGLMRGLLMKPGVEARSMLVAGQAHGVLTSVASERVLRFTPPLTIDARTIDEALELLARAASTLEPPA
jgi:acetylornithine/N-succinyldiaminopimelate aminotransferase